jgi:hypothetical protein
LIYTGNTIIGNGELNEHNEIAYSEMLVPFLDSSYHFNDYQIAFAPDGQTGFFAALAYSETEETPYTKYHPVMMKTIDGGESWNEPIHVQLGGTDGIGNIKNYFSDEAIENAGYEAGFNRDEIYYMMGYHFDLSVDEAGNPYLTGILALANEEGWYPYETQMATWNLYSEDGGESWQADALYDNIWFEGKVGNISVYNRPYISTSQNGQCLFFSWLDTDLGVATENNRPNLYFIAYSTDYDGYSEVWNVSYFTQAWNQAFFGSQANSFFVNIYGGEIYECEIPFFFVEFTVPGDELSPINYWYIDGYGTDFLCPCAEPVNIQEKETLNTERVHCYPNPAQTYAEITVNYQTNGFLTLLITDLTGQLVFSEKKQSYALAHTFRIDVSDFSPGVYIYTILAGNQSVTNKLVVTD